MANWQIAKRWMHTSLRKENNFSGGINVGNPAMAISDHQSTDEYGWDTDQTPAVHTRKGRTPYGVSGAANTNLLTNFNTTHLVRAVGTALQYDNAGTWTAIAGTFANVDWDATNYEVSSVPYLLLTNGTDNVKKWSGTVLSDLSANAPKGKYITNDTYRVFIALADSLYCSGLNDATDWTSAQNSAIIRYVTPNGGDITAVRNFYGDKYIWKADCFSTLQGTDYFNFRLKEISNQIGCVSFKTIQEVQTPSNSALFWLGQNDVYMFNSGLPIAIGQNIRSYLDSVNTAQWSKCFGATDGLKYYLGLVTGANTQPDTFLVYDPRYQQWRISSLSDNFRYSANLNNVWYVGDSAGLTKKMNQGTTDNGTAINWSITSKAFDEGAPEMEKEYNELHIQAYVPVGSTLNVYVSTDERGTSFTLIDTIVGSAATAQNSNIIIPLDTVALTSYLRYKLSGTGEVSIYSVERYGTLQPVQS
jgi:hypothetical protein